MPKINRLDTPFTTDSGHQVPQRRVFTEAGGAFVVPKYIYRTAGAWRLAPIGEKPGQLFSDKDGDPQASLERAKEALASRLSGVAANDASAAARFDHHENSGKRFPLGVPGVRVSCYWHSAKGKSPVRRYYIRAEFPVWTATGGKVRPVNAYAGNENTVDLERLEDAFKRAAWLRLLGEDLYAAQDQAAGESCDLRPTRIDPSLYEGKVPTKSLAAFLEYARGSPEWTC